MGGILSRLAGIDFKSRPGGSVIRLAVILFLLRKFKKQILPYLRAKYDEPMRDRIGRVLLDLAPPLRKEYAKEVNKNLIEMREGVRKKWKDLGTPLKALPEYGYSIDSLKHVVDIITNITLKRCTHAHMSGTIYSYSLKKGSEDPSLQGPVVFLSKDEDDEKKANNNGSTVVALKSPVDLSTGKDLAVLSKGLGDLFTYSFKGAYLWNSLHSTEFGVGDWLSYQVVRMVGQMYGGKPSEVMGFHSTGGTASLMNAMRCYRDWGIQNRGHAIGEGVILCLDSIHAAVNKAGQAYNLHVEMLKCDDNDKVSLSEVRKAAKRIGNRLVCIIGSAPSYPLGVMDPIADFAKIARDAGVGCHVDGCLGGFIVNNLDELDTNFLSIPGVTSLSCDTHKNGWAPKGSSVLVTRPIPDRKFGTVNLAYYSFYSIPSWSGGLYGTPANPGSQHVTGLLHAYLAMMHIGKDGYRKIARMVNNCAKEMADIIRRDDRLQIIGDHVPAANVVAWKISEATNWGKGAIYAFAHEMQVRGIVLSAVKGRKVHFCVTGRSAGDPEFINEFESAISGALEATEKHAAEVKAGIKGWPGDAGLYGTLEAAMEPSSENTTSRAEYVQNWLLGNRGARDGIKMYFYGIQDPYIEDLMCSP